jgi:ACS family hexuronate transporter-like MFS transporter
MRRVGSTVLHDGKRPDPRTDLSLHSSPKRWTMLALLTALYAVGSFGFLAVSPLSPFLRDGFGLTRFQVGLLVPAVYVGGLVFSIPAGRLADRLGPRACLTSGLTLGGLMLLVGAAATGFPTFLMCLVVTGIGWSVVNPALGRALFELFAARERGFAMGIKQMGQTVGGIAAALVLPIVAEQWGWRLAIGSSAMLLVVFVGLASHPMSVFRSEAHKAPAMTTGTAGTPWWWLRRAALLVVFGAGLGLGMVQSAFLSYFPLFAIQALGLSKVGAGVLLGVAQTGGAAARLGLGAVSDRWLEGRRVPGLVLTSALTAGAFMLLTWSPGSGWGLQSVGVFCAGAGVLGWVGLYMVLSAELGGAEHAGSMTGVGVAFLLAGILLGGPLFGVVLENTDSYAMGWTVFALISGGIGAALWAFSSAIHRECIGEGRGAETASAAISGGSGNEA